ncbi:Holliday junction branch migration protein RuvA [Herbiconiux liangxiaofengii]|uniref:Holliday junction branch migration protein RuvA n=1 Tax=Herbiconiux liangxiaofengii TaxID=3342795 RepID=UPI0035BAC981
MIAHLSGTVLQLSPRGAIIDTGGVGHSVELTASHAAALTVGAAVSMPTVLVVREDALTLFGFAGDDDRTVFEHLVTVTGVGPRSALATLGALDTASIATAIESDDDRPFRTVPGIGPKTARLIVMSLRGKLSFLAADTPESEPAPVDTPARGEALSALLSLGWKPKQAALALETVFTADPARAERMTSALLIRAALAELT